MGQLLVQNCSYEVKQQKLILNLDFSGANHCCRAGVTTALWSLIIQLSCPREHYAVTVPVKW